MKSVLILSSSPRKNGNSELLCKAFAEGAQAAGHRVEHIRIAEKRIGYCIACYACKQLGRCAFEDDASAILEKMLAADVIVLASPVYFYSISAQLKALFDRTVAIYPRLTNKTYYYLLTMADTERKQFDLVLAAMRGFLDCYEGSREAGMVCADGVEEAGAVANTPFVEAARALGQAIA